MFYATKEDNNDAIPSVHLWSHRHHGRATEFGHLLHYVSLVVIPSVFLSGVRMDYYHLPWRFQYSITGPMGYLDLSEFFIRRHMTANEEASPAGATTGQPHLHMSADEEF